jgi:prophage regulatory protein
LPSAPSSHRPLHSAESRAVGQYPLFQSETALNMDERQTDRASSQLEKHGVEQRRRIPRQLNRRKRSSQSESPEIQNSAQRVGRTPVSTRRSGVSDRSWQSVPKKLPQPQPAEQERPDDDATSVDELSFLRLPDVKALTGLSKTSLYTMIRDGSFPAPVRLGPRAVAWLRSEVRQWAMERVQASRSAA